MSLTFTVLRCPDSVAPETRHVAGGEFTVGRGPGVDWVLPDPERILSKRHFVVAFRAGGWQLADTSTNGTFLNRESGPIGHNDVRSLRDGDRVRLGQYEIELRLAEDAAPHVGGAASGASASGRGVGQGSGQGTRQGAGQSFAFDDPFAPIGAPIGAPFGLDPFHSPQSSPAGSLSDEDLGLRLPDDFDPLAPDPAENPFHGPTQPDHSPVLEDAFRPPRPTGQQLPDDWDNALEGIAPPGAPASPPAVPPPTAVASPPPFEAPTAPPAPAPAPVARAAEPAPISRQDDSLLAAFLNGAGLPDAAPADPTATMHQLGETFRALVGGLRAVLIARAAIKSEFRIEQTMIRARGNNPLKFSAGEDDALTALLGVGRRTDMAPAEAVADALRDLRLHELASMSAMQTAVRTLLDRLDPARLRAPSEQNGLALLSAQRKARAWDAYEALHAQTVQALADDFDSVFGKAFARAYERALSDVAAREQP